MDWEHLIGSVGFPIALIIGMLVAAWRIGKFFAPLVKIAFEKHFILVDNLTQQANKIKEGLEQQVEFNRVVLYSHKVTHKTLTQIAKALLEISPPDQKAEVKMHLDRISEILRSLDRS